MQAKEPTSLSWSEKTEGAQLNSYEVLQVHPAAPLDLITAAYWRLAGKAQSRRAVDKTAEGDLHGLTRAYQTLTNPSLRADYDRSIGVAEQNLAPQVPHARSRGFFGRGKRDPGSDTRVDYYEILRITPTAEAPIVEEAYSTLRTYYVRLVQGGYSPIELLDYLEEAYVVASDPDLRARYDSERERASNSSPLPVTAVAAAAPRPKTPKKPKAAATLARPKTIAVRVSPNVRSQGRSHLGAITGAFGALGRQLSTMSKREQQHSDDRRSEHEHDQVDTSEIEAALLLRISSSVEGPEGVDSVSADAPRSVARLTVLDGPNNGESFEIQGFPLTLGGNPECDITLPGLASEQARLLFRDGRFVVYNLAPRDIGAAAESEAWSIVESGGDLGLGPYRLRFTTVNG
jgi:curved DNA-binding protein CbpA